MSLVTPITVLKMPRPVRGDMAPRRREGTAEILILPCIRHERLSTAESILRAAEAS